MVVIVLSADKTAFHWRAHGDKARTELLEALGAERDKPLQFFVRSIGSASGSGDLVVCVCGFGIPYVR